MYEYSARPVRVIDGDTVVMDIDLGFSIHHISSCRLYGINAYELKDKDPEKKELAKKGRTELEALLDITNPRPMRIQSTGLDKYGRPLVIIHTDQGVVNKKLVDVGLAVKYLDDDNKI